MTTFKLPDLGEGLNEAEIVHWHVSAGDQIAADQPLVSVETEKAVVEIPAPWAGRVVSLLGQPGDVIRVGAPLAEIEIAAPKDAGTLVGTLEAVPTAEAVRVPFKLGAEPPTARPPRMKAAPAVRELAERLGADLASIHGTGPDGAITRADVEVATSAGALQKGFEPLRGVRRAMARSMTRAGQSVVPATVTEEADVTAWPPDAEVTLLASEALIAAAAAEPSLNATFDGAHEARRLNENVDIGIAVDTDDGLIVPVLRTGAHKSREKSRAELRRLIEGAKARTLTREEMAQPTITLSNFGILGGLFATLIIVPPQVAILGIGRIREVPSIGESGLHRLLPLSLTFDHRAVTGAEAARFLTQVKANLESKS